jgi:hypothetical protein
LRAAASNCSDWSAADVGWIAASCRRRAFARHFGDEKESFASNQQRLPPNCMPSKARIAVAKKPSYSRSGFSIGYV